MQLRTMTAVAVEVIAWSALMVGLWVVTLSAVTVPEIVAAAAAGVASALGAAAARLALGGRWRVEARWSRWLVAWCGSLAADTAAVFTLAARHIRDRDVAGDFAEVALKRTAGGRPSEDLHRALAALVLSSTPGSVVYDSDPWGHRLFVHRIVDVPPDLETAVSR
jgi:multisubunit Na+/H+ antiporter MnhE subunit